MRNGSIKTRLALFIAAACALPGGGCNEGPPTRAELDAIAALQRVHGEFDLNPEGHAVRLILKQAEVNADDLAPLGQLHDLTFLSLERSSVTDAALAHLSGLTELKSLSLAGTQVTDSGLVHLKTLSALEDLDLEGLKISDRGLAELADIPSLKKVYVSKGTVTSKGKDFLESSNPRLHVTFQ